MKSPLRVCSLALPLFVTSCAGAPETVPAVVPLIATPPPGFSRVAEPKSFWGEDGAPTLGAELAEGTLVVLRGQRYLLRIDGSVTRAHTATPEPLVDVVLVPTAKGPVLVGHGAHDVYVFSEPLGEGRLLVRTNTIIRDIGAGPGLVAIRPDYAGDTRLVDVSDGTPAKAPWGAHPASLLAFVDMQRGAIYSHVAGLLVTTDGGATFSPVNGARARLEGSSPSLRTLGDAMFVRASHADAYRELDVSRRTLWQQSGPKFPNITPAPQAQKRTPHPMVRWLRATGADPLTTEGSAVLFAPGGAVAVGGGLAALLDPETGLVMQLTPLGSNTERCRMAVTQGIGYALCRVPVRAGHPDPYATVLDELHVDLFQVEVGKGQIAAKRLPLDARLVRGADASTSSGIFTSPRGGVLFLGSCQMSEQMSPKPGTFCVRQPDGSFKTILAPKHDKPRLAVGPLASGGISYVTEESTPTRALRVTQLGASDPPTTRAHVELVGTGSPRVHGATVSEGENGDLSFVWQMPHQGGVSQNIHFISATGEVKGGNLASAVGIGASGDAAAPGAKLSVSRQGEFLAAWTPRDIRLSSDGGNSWFDPKYPFLENAAGSIASARLAGRSLRLQYYPSRDAMSSRSVARFGFASDVAPLPAVPHRASAPELLFPDLSKESKWPARRMDCKTSGVTDRAQWPANRVAVEALFPALRDKEMRRIVLTNHDSRHTRAAIEWRRSQDSKSTAVTVKWIDNEAAIPQVHTAAGTWPLGDVPSLAPDAWMEIYRVDSYGGTIGLVVVAASKHYVVYGRGGQLSVSAMEASQTPMYGLWLAPRSGEVHWTTHGGLVAYKPGGAPTSLLPGAQSGLRSLLLGNGRAAILATTRSHAVHTRELPSLSTPVQTLEGWRERVTAATEPAPSGWIGRTLPTCKPGTPMPDALRVPVEHLSVLVDVEGAGYRASAETVVLWGEKDLCVAGLRSQQVVPADRGLSSANGSEFGFRWDARTGRGELTDSSQRAKNTTLLTCKWAD